MDYIENFLKTAKAGQNFILVFNLKATFLKNSFVNFNFFFVFGQNVIGSSGNVMFLCYRKIEIFKIFSDIEMKP